MADTIIVEHLTIHKGNINALADVSLKVGQGRLTGLIGPSGSGKTTLLRAIVGTQQITTGTIKLNGLPAGSKQLRSLLGYVTQSPAIYEDITVEQNLIYFATIAGLLKKARRQAINEVLAKVDLERQRKQLASSLSGGQRARVSLAIALIGDAPFLILDEPTVGLDPVLRRDLWRLFQELVDQGRTILVSSHVMDEAERCADLILLRNGRVLYQGPKVNLLKQTATSDVEAAFLRLIEESEPTNAS